MTAQTTTTIESNVSDWRHSTDADDGSKDWIKTHYGIVVPTMLVFCILSMVANLIIFISARWIRRNLSPTLRFSISLAGADAYASFVVGMGLIINSLLPVTFKVDLGSLCYTLVLECFRLAGLIVSVLHLLLLALNHYIGIIRPLHYASTMTRRNAMMCIATMWVVPIVFFFSYCSIVPDEGFQSENCRELSFIIERKFRVIVSCLFFVPLVLMSIMYCHIFVIVKQHNRGFGEHHDSRQFRRNVKAAVTTLLILGTYAIGWMPAVLLFVIVCDDCTVRLKSVNQRTIFFVAMVTNTLIIIKFFVNPIIYAARMKDIRVALQRMSLSCLPSVLTQAHVPNNDDTTSSFIRSRNDTMATSLRMHSMYVGGNKHNAGTDSPTLAYQKCDNNTLVSKSPHNGRHYTKRFVRKQNGGGLLQTAITNSATSTLNESDSSIEQTSSICDQ